MAVDQDFNQNLDLARLDTSAWAFNEDLTHMQLVPKSHVLALYGCRANPLLHRLYLDHDIIFYFLDNIEKNKQKSK